MKDSKVARCTSPTHDASQLCKKKLRLCTGLDEAQATDLLPVLIKLLVSLILTLRCMLMCTSCALKINQLI